MTKPHVLAAARFLIALLSKPLPSPWGVLIADLHHLVQHLHGKQDGWIVELTALQCRLATVQLQGMADEAGQCLKYTALEERRSA